MDRVLWAMNKTRGGVKFHAEVSKSRCVDVD